MEKIFNDFDFSNFWENSDYSNKKYRSEEPTKELVESIETELGYKLPDSYIKLMKSQNGGITKNTCFPTNEPTSWADDHIGIYGIMGIGRKKDYSLCGDTGSQFMIDEWGYPEIGICICDTPTGGHDMIMLDYSKCGNDGEPEVVHVDQEDDYEITFLAKDFESFVKGLVNEDVYDTSEEDLKNALEMLENGKFSTILQSFFEKNQRYDFDKILRNILLKLTHEKGNFALHSDELSYLVYDIQFYLYSNSRKVSSVEKYLEEYPNMIAFGDGEITSSGYAPGFIEDWMNDRLSNKAIAAKFFKGMKFSKEYETELLDRLNEYK
jgi:SMI1/KNR4 family protein SUKH-1